MRTEYFPLRGGLDLVSSALTISPGSALHMLNYEVDVNGGYRSAAGYERFDGRPKPSEATFTGIGFSANTTGAGAVDWTAGVAVTGGTSGATGTITAVVIRPPGETAYINEPFGTYDASTAYVGVMTFASVTGTFVDGETITGGGGQTGTLTTAPLSNYALTAAQELTSFDAVWDARRTVIAVVPGSGAVRGGFRHGADVFAFRDFDATYKKMYKSTTSGWTEVALGNIVNFDAGVVEIEVGDTIQDPTAGTGTVKAVVLQSGSWGTTAAGYIIYTGSATWGDNQDIDVGGVLHATSNGASSAQTLLKGGKVESILHNFFGATGTRKTYFVDGVNTAFEFDGTTLVPIKTGMTTDTPTHLAAYAGRLWLAFPKGSLQYSSVNGPLTWSPLSGASEIGVGDEITGLTETVDALAVHARNATKVMFGTSSSDFVLKTASPDVGAIEWTTQNLGRPYFLDDRGITPLTAVQEYGNFSSVAISQAIAPLLLRKAQAGTTAVCSTVVRNRNVYRIFFDDGYSISATFFGNKLLGFGYQLYGIQPYAMWSGENASGEEEVYAFCDDGFVYQMEIGKNFDGENVETSIKLAFAHNRSPRQRKRYRTTEIELVAPSNLELSIQPDFAYTGEDYPAAAIVSADISAGGSFYGGGIYGETIFGAQTIATARARIDGTAKNISLLITGQQIASAHVLQGVTLGFDLRRPER